MKRIFLGLAISFLGVSSALALWGSFGSMGSVNSGGGGIQETWEDPDVASLIVNLNMNSGDATSRLDVAAAGNNADLIFGANAPTLFLDAYTNQYGTTLDAIEFDGVNDIATIAYNVAMEQGKCLIMCYVMPVITYDSSETSSPGIWSHANGYIDAMFRPDGTIRYVKFDGTARESFTATASWPAGEWFHLAFNVGHDQDMRIYVNGVVNESVHNTSASGWTDAGVSWDFGARSTDFGNIRIASWRMYDTNTLTGTTLVGLTNIMAHTHPTNYIAKDIHD